MFEKVRACKSILLMVSRMPQDEMVCVGWDDRAGERRIKTKNTVCAGVKELSVCEVTHIFYLAYKIKMKQS